MPSEQRAGLESSIPPPKPIPAVQHFNDFARLDQNAPKNDLASPRKEDELDPVRVLVKRPMKLSELERFAIEAALQRTGGNVTRAMRQLGIGRTTPEGQFVGETDALRMAQRRSNDALRHRSALFAD